MHLTSETPTVPTFSLLLSSSCLLGPSPVAHSSSHSFFLMNRAQKAPLPVGHLSCPSQKTKNAELCRAYFTHGKPVSNQAQFWSSRQSFYSKMSNYTRGQEELAPRHHRQGVREEAKGPSQRPHSTPRGGSRPGPSCLLSWH